jgi:hypothetical protein
MVSILVESSESEANVSSGDGCDRPCATIASMLDWDRGHGALSGLRARFAVSDCEVCNADR